MSFYTYPTEPYDILINSTSASWSNSLSEGDTERIFIISNNSERWSHGDKVYFLINSRWDFGPVVNKLDFASPELDYHPQDISFTTWGQDPLWVLKGYATFDENINSITGSILAELSLDIAEDRTTEGNELVYVHFFSDSNYRSDDVLAFYTFNIVDTSTGDSHVYRLRSRKTGEYLFSNNSHEINTLTTQTKHDYDPLTGVFSANGWENEGIAFTSREDAKQPLYRFLNLNTGLHFYSANDSEATQIINNLDPYNFLYEGIAFNVYSADSTPSSESLSIRRFLHATEERHIYSSSAYEQIQLANSHSWIDEGIAWFA